MNARDDHELRLHQMNAARARLVRRASRSRTHPRVYHMLVVYGHSPAKALEILLDARRGDAHALGYVRVARRLTPTDWWVQRHRRANP